MQDLSCGMWDPVPQAGIESQCWQRRVLATGPPGKSPGICFHWLRYADGNSGHDGSRLYSQIPKDGSHGTPHRATWGALRSIRRQREQGESMDENAFVIFVAKKIDEGG